jgi:hypothetical protein
MNDEQKIACGGYAPAGNFFYALIQINFEEPHLLPVPTANR